MENDKEHLHVVSDLETKATALAERLKNMCPFTDPLLTLQDRSGGIRMKLNHTEAWKITMGQDGTSVETVWRIDGNTIKISTNQRRKPDAGRTGLLSTDDVPLTDELLDELETLLDALGCEMQQKYLPESFLSEQQDTVGHNFGDNSENVVGVLKSDAGEVTVLLQLERKDGSSRIFTFVFGPSPESPLKFHDKIILRKKISEPEPTVQNIAIDIQVEKKSREAELLMRILKALDILRTAARTKTGAVDTSSLKAETTFTNLLIAAEMYNASQARHTGQGGK